ncbi:recombinase family protein [Bradyrhizobium sp. Ai1a-2]|uniref:recombinase family protein n=1 Tax=Bradyrhizobium sp. Ai1a-2 TaxID=196490 RepID=UPI00210F4E9C|nr:recombinase family protein [Bradyrhizobium sp. Ai1a-2]
MRMSTDKQKYSTENQKDAIAAYAARRGLTIARTYSDEGRSGLNIDRREALQRLINDVKSGRADFEFILVYDVSPWGRFQDADESAYYEFVCKEAGIRVLYCAELFENDGSLPSTLLKAFKRAMAGEFVRELSTKVFIGQFRIAKMGFWRGGFPGYGLRRQLVDESGAIKGQLELGQRKSLQTDRVVLVHGPAIEVDTIKRIFRSFVTERRSENQIAAELNADQIPTMLGNRWEPENITKLLTNEKYLGHIIFNRTSAKLRGKHRLNPPDMWIRRDNAFPALIEPELFKGAQEIIVRRRQGRSEIEMLARMATLRSEKGYLTAAMIEADQDLPSTETLRRHYGSLMDAYKLIDYQPSRLVTRTNVAAKRRSIAKRAAIEIGAKIKSLGGKARFEEGSQLIRIQDEFLLSVCVARATRERLGRLRWYAQVDRCAKADLTGEGCGGT